MGRTSCLLGFTIKFVSASQTRAELHAAACLSQRRLHSRSSTLTFKKQLRKSKVLRALMYSGGSPHYRFEHFKGPITQAYVRFLISIFVLFVRWLCGQKKREFWLRLLLYKRCCGGTDVQPIYSLLFLLFKYLTVPWSLQHLRQYSLKRSKAQQSPEWPRWKCRFPCDRWTGTAIWEEQGTISPKTKEKRGKKLP